MNNLLKNLIKTWPLFLFNLIPLALYLYLPRDTPVLFPPNTVIREVEGEYSYANTTNVFQTHFKNSPIETDGILFENQRGEITFHTPKEQTFGQLLAGEPEVRNNTITYKNIYPNLDLKYTVSSTQLLEEFIVHSKSTAESITRIDQEGYTASDYKENKDGSITFSNGGEKSFVLPRPILYEQDNHDEKSYGIQYELKEIDSGKLRISKVITEEGLKWLKEDSRDYPIVIDLVIDNADTAGSWVSSDATNLVVSQETSIKQEGTGSVKIATNDHTGNGADGAITVSTATNINSDNRISGRSCADGGDAVNYSATALTSTTATLSSTPSAGCLAIGDEILIINLQGTSANNTNVGNYETVRIQNVSTNTITFATSKTKFYGNGASDDTNIGTATTNQRVMIQRVPNYTNVTVNGSQTFNATAWNGTKAGVFFFKANGTVTVTGTISVAQLGYRGGTGTSCSQGNQGESYTGLGTTSHLANGGAGGSQQYPTNSWGGGAGGNYASGAANGTRLGGTGTVGQAGASYGSADLSKLFLGSGGGSGSEFCGAAASGSRGGGIAQVNANTITVTGSITAGGQNGNNDSDSFAGGGGGAGGSVLIKAYTATLGSTLVTSSGGTGGSGGGGAGGVGRIRVEADTISGTSSPAASTTTAPDNSLNDTATLTTSATDLSNQGSITFWVYSSRTGSFSRFEFGESASSEQAYSITIGSANTWEQKTWDISGITGTSRDAVTKFAFKMTDSSQTVTYYFDDLQTVIDNEIPNTPTLNSPADRTAELLLGQTFTTTADDPDGDDLQYKITLCKNPSMTYQCQIFDQTSSQTGWSGQDAQSSTMYSSDTQATYTVQSDLDEGTTYYWKSEAIDPDGINQWGNTQTVPYVFSTNSHPRSPSNNNYEHYIARRENAINNTSAGWGVMTGAAQSGTTASTNGWIDGTNLTAGEDYLIMVWGEHNSDNTSSTSGLRVKHGSTAFSESQSVEKTENTSTSHKTPYFWFTVWTAVAGEDLEVELYWGGQAGVQARAEDITLVAVNAEDLISNGDLQHDIDLAGGTLSTSPTAKASITWTPDNSGDSWWIMSYSQADIENNSSSITYNSRLDLNGTDYNSQQINGDAQLIGDTPIYGFGTITTLSDSSNTASLEISESGADQSWNAAGLLALRLNAFHNFFFDSYTNEGPDMDTEFEWIQQLNYDPLIQLQNHWLIAAGGLVTDANAQVVSRLQNSDANITDDAGGWTKTNNQPLATNLADVYTSWSAGLQDVDLDAQTTASGAANILDGWLMGISFEQYTADNGPRPDLPLNGATNQSIRTVLKTTAIDGDGDTMKYKIQICTNSIMTTGCQTFDQTSTQTGWSGQNANSFTRYQSGTQATYTIQSDLNTNTTYYWRAYALDQSGLNTFGDAGEIFSFTTTNAPTAPSSLQTEGLVNPTNVTDSTPELSAVHNDPDSDAAIYQRIQVNTQSDFAGTMMWNPGKTSMTSTANGVRSPQISYAGNALSSAVTYYWRIKFWDSKGAEGAWSSAATFIIGGLVPVNGCYMQESDDDTSITIRWNNTSSIEDGYRIQKSTDGGGFSTLIDKAANTTSHTDSAVSQGHTYRYRIAAKLGSDLGAYCTTTTASVQQGSIEFEGLQLGGIQIN